MINIARVLSLLIGLLFLCANASHALSVTRLPTSCTNVTGVGTQAWSSPSRAVSSNNSYATVSVSSGVASNYLKCLNYGFAIPTGAAINGITVSVERRTSNNGSGNVSKDAAVRVVKGGTIGPTDGSTTTAYTTSDVTESHGGATSLWGQTWTAADINSGTFGAAFAATMSASTKWRTISVDLISITVDYAPDTTPPNVAAIARANTNPSSAASVSWSVTFSEAVTGVDAFDFQLTQAGGVAGAAITSVTGSGANWTVTASTGSGSGTLGLNLIDNDSIMDVSSNKLGGTGVGNGNFPGEVYTIDRTNPVVNSISRVTPTPTNAASLQWTVIFSESVTGVDATDFVTALTGVSSGAISVTGSGTTYTVTVAGISGAGSIGLNLVDNDSIVDATVGNKLGGTGTVGTGNGSATGQVYIYDRVAPIVVSIAADSPSPFSGNQVSWTVKFSESVTGVDPTDFSLIVGSGLAGTSLLSVTGSGDTWSVQADTGYGAGTLGLNLVNNSSIVDSISNPLNNSFTGDVYTISDTPALAAYRLDESFWNGTTDEVLDQQGRNPGTAKNSATTADGSRALTGNPGTCRYGQFYTTTKPKGYVDLTVDFPYMVDDFTVAGWIRTTSNSATQQFIFTHSSGNKVGYVLSLGDAGTGRLRFRSGTAPTNLDSPSGASSLLANNTWYFVAAVADFSAAPSVTRTLYVFDASGSLLSGYPVSVSTSDWDPNEIGAASIGGDGSNSLRGNLDEVQVFDKVLNPAALTQLAKARHSCGAVSLDHIELQSSSGATGLTCASNTLTIKACLDATCNTTYAGGVSGTLSAAGTPTVTWDATTGCTGTCATSNGFDIPSGFSSVTKNVHVSTAGSVLFGATTSTPTAINPSTCSFGSPACTFTANTAGFIFSNSTTGGSYTIPAQVSGIATGTLYLRAVQASTTNAAVCTPAIISQSNVPVQLNYNCNNPATCQTGSLATINSTAISSSATAVNLNFDANASAPITVRYDDVGQITLAASKTMTPPGGSTVTLTGSSNALVVAPHHFGFSGISAGPIKAGNSFAAVVTAYNGLGTPSATRNFGKESTPAGVSLSFTKCLPTGAGTANGSFSGGVGSFDLGVASASNLSWSEVGNGDLTVTLAGGSYLSSGLSASGNTGTSGTVCNGAGNVGRFTPDYFETAIIADTAPIPCPAGLTCPANSSGASGMAYANQPIVLKVTAKNATGGTTANYQGVFAKVNNFSAWSAAGSAGTANPGGGTIANTALAGAAFSAGVGITPVSTPNTTKPTYALGTVTTAPTDVYFRAVDTDGITSLRTSPVEAGLKVASGRIRIPNVYGSERLALPMAATVQYYSGSYWLTSATDNVTSFNSNLTTGGGNLVANIVSGPLAAVVVSGPGTVTFLAGVRAVTLAAPLAFGSANISIDPTAAISTYLPSMVGRATFGIYKSPLIYRRENY